MADKLPLARQMGKLKNKNLAKISNLRKVEFKGNDVSEKDRYLFFFT